MNKEDRELLRHMSETLDEMLAVMSKPVKLIERIFTIGSAIAGTLAIIGIIDIIKS